MAIVGKPSYLKDDDDNIVIPYTQSDMVKCTDGRNVQQWLDDIEEVDLSEIEGRLNVAENNINLLEKQIERVFINVLDHGVDASGTTDCTLKLREIFRIGFNQGYVNVFFPRGTYIIDDYVDIYSNTVIEFEEGSIVTKSDTATSHYTFVCGRVASEGTTGYGGGAKNVIIRNGHFKGNYTSMEGISFTFNHMANCLIENCYFENCITADHVMDLCGCNNIVIQHCTFRGWNVVTGREYTEAIQIDNSSARGLSNDFSNYDDLATRDVLIDNCNFLPVYDNSGDILYACPIPVGSHNFIGDNYFTNIHFTNNYVENHGRQPGSHTAGCIRFYLVDGLYIQGNTFNNAKHFNGYCIVLQTKVDDLGPPAPCKNIFIENNVFKGFQYEGVDHASVIRFLRHEDDTTSYHSNILISGNRFEDCHPDLSRPELEDIPIMIYGSHARCVRVIGNACENSRRLVYCRWVEDIVVSENICNTVLSIPVSAFDTVNMTVSNNQFIDCGHLFYVRDSKQVNISNNISSNTTAPLHLRYNGIMMFNACNIGSINNNTIEMKAGTNTTEMDGVITIYTGAANMTANNNVCVGFPFTESTLATNTTIDVDVDAISLKKYNSVVVLSEPSVI